MLANKKLWKINTKKAKNFGKIKYKCF